MRTNTSKLVMSALFVALSIVLTRIFSANLLVFGVPAVRLAAGFVPIMLASISLGPYYGMIVGTAADILGFLLFPSGVYFPPITLTSALVGILPFAVYRLAVKLPEWLRLFLAVTVTQVVCSMLLQTLWLSMLYGTPFALLLPPRALTVLVTIPVYYLLIYAVMAGLRRARLYHAV